LGRGGVGEGRQHPLPSPSGEKGRGGGLLEEGYGNVKLAGIKNLDKIAQWINTQQINIIASSDFEGNRINRMDKFDRDIINPLSDIILNILNDNTLTLEEKQLAIERATLT